MIGGQQRAAQKPRLSARLTEAETGRLVWSGHFEADLGDVSAFQDDAAAMTVAQLAVQTAPPRGPGDRGGRRAGRTRQRLINA